MSGRGMLPTLAVPLVLAILATACGPSGSTPAASAAGTAAAKATRTPRVPPAPVRAGIVNVDSDAPIVIAKERGYFSELGIAIDLVPFDNQAQMIPAMASGQLEVGGGPAAAGLFNSILRGIDLKAVADRGSLTKGHGYATFTVRKDLIDSGAVKEFKDFKGRKIATSGFGTSSHFTIVTQLEKAGLKKGEYDIVELPPPQMVAAMTQKAIDAAFLPEPFSTRLAQSGTGVTWKKGDEVALGEHIAILLYAGAWAAKNPDVARDFMVAYLRGARDYIDAFDVGKDKDPIVRIMTAYTKTDPALYDKLIKTGYDANGALDPKRLDAQQTWYHANGFQEQKVEITKVIDLQYVEYAASILGRRP